LGNLGGGERRDNQKRYAGALFGTKRLSRDQSQDRLDRRGGGLGVWDTGKERHSMFANEVVLAYPKLNRKPSEGPWGEIEKGTEETGKKEG